METKKTEWYDGDQKPVHIGVYERDMTLAFKEDADLIYSYWNGIHWVLSSDSVEGAELEFDYCDFDSYYQDLPWRGLTR